MNIRTAFPVGAVGLIALLALGIASFPHQEPSTAEPDGDSLHVATSMGQARAAHTATALVDGNVLVVGGFTRDESQVAGAELFVDKTGRFERIGRPENLRQSHTATRLRDGRVLLAGGLGEGGRYLNAAELYDPATASFSETGKMTVARANHVAVALTDGRMLLVGGTGTGWVFLASAEVYDPRTGTFTATAPMGEAREGHVAVRLADGRVLVTGGHRGRGSEVVISRTAEIYDVATGQFTPTGAMTTHRHKHDAVTLGDGLVLVLGGADERDNNGVYSSVEMFDPATGSFQARSPMRMGRYKHRGTSIVLSHGALLLAGGAVQAEEYDPATGASEFVAGASQLAGQFSAVASLPGGRALITGGYGSGQGPGRTPGYLSQLRAKAAQQADELPVAFGSRR